jgi:hypothetical protein
MHLSIQLSPTLNPCITLSPKLNPTHKLYSTKPHRIIAWLGSEEEEHQLI